MLSHQIYRASAGSGKTFQLARRIIRLLMDGTPVESIVALTFTRKAAAEFVARALTGLAKAAADAGAAAELARQIERPELTRADFAATLKSVTDSAHRLRFGTMDGFFQTLLRTHPLEFGLPGTFSLLDARAGARAHARILRHLLRARRDDSTDAFLASFRLANHGKHARSLVKNLESFTADTLALYRKSGDDPGSVWGAAAPFSAPAPAPTQEAFDALVARALETVGQDAGIADSLKNSLLKKLEKMAGWSPAGSATEQNFDIVLDPRLRDHADAGQPLPKSFGRAKGPSYLDAGTCRVLADLGDAVIARVLDTKLAMARGAAELIARYLAEYDATLSATGALGFADIQERLARPAYRAHLENAAFRLDGKTRHWLFDEFQDTSRETWSILETCLSGALQDAEGERTVFFVGDTKQAIYAWNGGDHRLLPEIETANDIPAEPLAQTRRCCPAIVDAVNAVFGTVSDTGLDATAAAEWSQSWTVHESGGDAAKLAGVVLRHEADFSAPATDDGAGESGDTAGATQANLRLVIDRLAETDALGKGLSVAILTRTGKEVTAGTAALRAAGIPCAGETDTNPASDNLVTTALLAWLRAVVHPGDRLAEETVRLTPLAAAYEADPARARLLATFTARGAEETVRLVMALGEAALPADPFSLNRIGQLLEIAREYDATGERDLPDFLDFAAGTLRRDKADASRVQVMTIHKSKGLEFDLVFLPFVGTGGGIDALGKSPFVALPGPRPESPPQAVIARVPAEFAERIPPLKRLYAEERATNAYESLCLLYVAMTRAKRELFIVTPPLPKSGESFRWTHLLDHAFGSAKPDGDTGHGTRDWHAGITAVPSATPPAPLTPLPEFPHPVFAPKTVAPSEHAHADFAPEPGFTPLGKAFGTELHRLAEHLGKISIDETLATILARLEELAPGADPGLTRLAKDHLATALRRPDFLDALRAPPGATVYNELAYTRLRDTGELESGAFDRVTRYPDGNLLIQDFKTDACAPATLRNRYGEAMHDYRRAAAELFGISPRKIRLQLLHTPTGTCLPIE